MLAILNSLNTHNFPIFEPILMILVSKFMAHRALSDKIYLLLGLLSPLILKNFLIQFSNNKLIIWSKLFNSSSLAIICRVKYYCLIIQLTLKGPPIICSRRQLQILPLFQK